MYRIEVATGDETVFRTIEELATGIRNGVITPRSRIYHAASQKWLPIEFHPHYKKALDLVTGGAPVIDTGPTRPISSPRRAPAPEPRPVASSVPIAPPAPRPEPRAPRAVLPPAPVAPAPAPVAPPPEPVAVPRVEPRPVEARVAPPAADYRRTFEPVPEIELPKISYPEVPSSADAMPVARRRHGGPGRLAMGGIVAALLVGGYLVTTFSASRSDAAEPVEAPAPAPEPSPSPAAIPAPAEAPAAEAARRPSVERPPVTVRTAPAGELPAARPAGPVSQAWSSSAGAIAAPPPPPSRVAPAPQGTTGPEPAITPPPAALDLALPQVPVGDSLISRPATQRDSAAIKRILRAVTGAPAGGSSGR